MNFEQIHEENKEFQQKIINQVLSLVETLKEIGKVVIQQTSSSSYKQ